MDGMMGIIIFFTFLIFVECSVDGFHNDTNSGVSKAMVKKCCPEGKHLIRGNTECISSPHWINQSIPNIALYRHIDNTVPVLSDKKLYDVYDIEIPGNETFDPNSWYEFSKAGHQIFLTDVSTQLFISHY